MKKFTALFTDSLEELKHVNTVTVMAMFAAISVVLGYFYPGAGGLFEDWLFHHCQSVCLLSVRSGGRRDVRRAP